MLSNKTRHTVHQDHAKSMDGAALLWLFLTARIFAVGALRQIYAHHNHFVMESCKPGLGPPNPQTKSVRHTTATSRKPCCASDGRTNRNPTLDSYQ